MEKQSTPGTLRKKRWFRIILKIFLSLILFVILAFGGASIYIYYKGNNLLKDYLIKTVASSSKGIYHLELQRLSINLLNGRINLLGLHLVPDTALYAKRSKTDTLAPMLIDARISKFQVRGFSIRDILINRKVDIGKILINAPELTIILKRASTKAEKQASNPRMLAIPLPKGLQSLCVHEIRLEKGKLTIDDQSKQPAEKFMVPVIDIAFDNLLVDSTHKGIQRILNTDDIRIGLKGIVLKTKNGMYTIAPGEINLSTGKSLLSVSNLKITPNYSRKDFSRTLGYQMDRMEISIGKVSLQNLDLRQLLVNRKFIAGTVLVDGLVVDDYRDKRVPMRPDFKPLLPQQGLLKSKGYIKIDTVKLTNGKVTYSEQVGEDPGSLFFDKMNGTIYGITNDSVLVQQGAVMKVSASMYLMGKGLLNAGIDIPLGAKKDAFTFSAMLTNLDLTEINPMLTKLFPAEVTSGKAEKMIMTAVKADDDKAMGKMDFYYKDLQIKMNATEQSTWNRIKSGTISWAANVYVKNENPKNGKFTQGIVYFERDKHKSIFNFLWKSTFSGIKSTIGINKKEQKELKKAGTKKKK